MKICETSLLLLLIAKFCLLTTFITLVLQKLVLFFFLPIIAYCYEGVSQEIQE